MNIKFTVQIYLDFVIPRGSEWQAFHFKEPGGDEIYFGLRGIGEPLFPSAVDKHLPAMKITITKTDVFRENPQISHGFGYLDRFQVVVKTSVSSLEEARRMSFQRRILDIATKYADIFLSHCRAISLSSHVKPIPIYFQPERKRTEMTFPSTIICEDEENAPVDIFECEGGIWVNGRAISATFVSPETRRVSFSELYSSLLASEAPKLYRSILADADGLMRQSRYREAIVSCATSCEVVIGVFLSKAGRRKKVLWRTLERSLLNVSFAERMCHEMFKFLGTDSLKEADIELFGNIEELYRARNVVVHQGLLKIGNRDITNDDVYRYWQAARDFMLWMEQKSTIGS